MEKCMGLKLTVGVEDKIIMSDGVVIDVRNFGKRVTLEFTAPDDIKINAIFKDPNQQFKNLRREK
jgi:hypothetical protein